MRKIDEAFIRDFISRHGIEIKSETGTDPRLLNLKSCPFCGDASGNPRILIYPDGGVQFKEHRDTCQDKTLRDFIQHYEPEFYKKPEAQYATENGKVKPIEPPPPLRVVSAQELYGLDLKPMEFIVKDVVPVGLSLLAAPPKSYKSFMCLDMALSVAAGRSFLGFYTYKCGVVYFDLESTLRRPRWRIRQILGGEDPPDNLYIATEAARLNEGFKEQLQDLLKEHPEIRLVIVDVFRKIQPPAGRRLDAYERDYADYGEMKHIADELSIAILMVTHTRKMRDTDDPYNEISGSIGVTGTLDAMLMIRKEKREDQAARLFIKGRDAPEQCYEIEFDKDRFVWEMKGNADELEELRKDIAYSNSPIVQTIRKGVEQNGGEWEVTTEELITASRYFNSGRFEIYGDIRKIGQQLSALEAQLREKDGILRTSNRGHGGKRKNTFRKMETQEEINV